jgi:chromosome segregation ATPase
MKCSVEKILKFMRLTAIVWCLVGNEGFGMIKGVKDAIKPFIKGIKITGRNEYEFLKSNEWANFAKTNPKQATIFLKTINLLKPGETLELPTETEEEGEGEGVETKELVIQDPDKYKKLLQDYNEFPDTTYDFLQKSSQLQPFIKHLITKLEKSQQTLENTKKQLEEYKINAPQEQKKQSFLKMPKPEDLVKIQKFQNEALTKERDNIKKELEQLKKEQQVQSNKETQTNKEITIRDSKINELNSHITQLQTRIEETAQKIQTLQSDNANLLNQTESFKKQLEETQQNTEKTKDLIKTQEAQFKEIQSSAEENVREAQETIKKNEEVVSNLRKELEESKNEIEKLKKSGEQEKKEAELKIEEFKKQLETVQEKNNQLEPLQQEIETLKQELAANGPKLEEALLEQKKQLEQEHKLALGELSETYQNNEKKLESSITELQQKHEKNLQIQEEKLAGEFKAKEDKLIEEINNLEQSKKELQQETEQTKSQLIDVNKKFELVQTSLANNQQALDSLTTEITNKNTRIQELEEKLQKTSESGGVELNNLKKEYALLLENRDNLKLRFDSLLAENKSLQEKLKELQNYFEANAFAILTESSNMAKELDLERTKAKEAYQALDKLTEDSIKLTDQVSLLKQDNKNLNEKFKDFVQQLVDIVQEPEEEDLTGIEKMIEVAQELKELAEEKGE